MFSLLHVTTQVCYVALIFAEKIFETAACCLVFKCLHRDLSIRNKHLRFLYKNYGIACDTFLGRSFVIAVVVNV